MEEFFLIGVRKIDSSWSLQDLKEEYNTFEYCMQVLDIPEEHLLDVKLTKMGLEVSLCDIDDDVLLYDDDWYTQLKRVADSAARVA